ncbi:group I truncated hemoglobin [Halomonas maura]|uniref:group I truncated hemoglobin n=1 Tax=Halomonas maura TaxID=117606 RepID=UPI0025B2ED41|nr:group 1 truncated hemoglobin [Halomonas maura]MDN3557434.1 group 1 truncated hemoglobin [Halomonas maura]
MSKCSRSLGAALAVFLMVVMPGTAMSQEGDEPQASLFERLGGLAPITVVVSDFIDHLVEDPVLNANPAVDAARQRVPAAYLKYRVTSLVCQSTGGPCQYQGRGMKESHAHLEITEAEWNHMVEVFKEVLAEHGVPDPETEELLAIVGSTRDDIVSTGSGS